MTDKEEWRSEKYIEAEQRLGESLGAWLNQARNITPKVSWQDIAYELRDATGVKVTHETCRTWLAVWQKHEGVRP